jgi:hypothetical protein
MPTKTEKPKNGRAGRKNGAVVDADACLACKAKKGKEHKDGCPNGECPRCHKSYAVGHEDDCVNHPRNRPGLNGSTGGPIETDDGEPAIVKKGTTPHEPPKRRSKPYPRIKVLPNALEALQQSYDNGDFSGDKQQQEKCEFESVIDGESDRCPHVVVSKKTITDTCPTCERKKKENVIRLCLGHAINVLGGGAPHRLQTEMNLHGDGHDEGDGD